MTSQADSFYDTSEERNSSIRIENGITENLVCCDDCENVKYLKLEKNMNLTQKLSKNYDFFSSKSANNIDVSLSLNNSASNAKFRCNLIASGSDVVSNSVHHITVLAKKEKTNGLSLNAKPDHSIETENVFYNLHGALGNSLENTSRFDRLLSNDSSLFRLKNRLSFSMSSETSPIATCSSSTDYSNINILKSPTFSMADISVVIPPNVLTNIEKDLSVMEESQLCQNDINEQIPSKLKGEPILASEIRHSDFQNHFETKCKNQNEKLFFPSADIANISCDSIINRFNVDQNKENAMNGVSESNTACCAQDKLVTSKIDHVQENFYSICQSGVESSRLLKSTKDNTFSDSIDDSGLLNSEEWHFVERARNKQKRKQNQTNKSNSMPFRFQSHFLVRTQASFAQHKQQHVNKCKKIPSSNYVPRAQSNHRFESRISQSNLSKIKTAKNSSQFLDNTNETARKTDVMLVPLVHDVSRHSIAINASSAVKDHANSPAVNAIPPTSQLSITVNQNLSEQTNMVAESDCEKMNSNETNAAVTSDISSNRTVDEHSADEHKPDSAEISTKDIVNNSHPDEQSSAGQETENNQENPATKLQGEELIRQLQTQLEYYFSRENLAQDPYLVSQMDPQQFVSIYTIANFNAIKKLTTDVHQVIEALKVSKLIEVDEKEEMVRPNPNLCNVILRDIPEDVKKAEVAALFEDCPAKYTYLEYAGNSNWYIQFASESDAHSAHLYLRENVREFKGKPILARVKTKSHHLNTYSFQTLSSNAAEEKDQSQMYSINQEPPQVHASNAEPTVPPPVDFMQSPPFLVTPPPHFTSPHPGPPPVAAIPSPLLARVAAPTSIVPVPSSGQGSVNVMPMNAPFVVSAPWNGFYPSDPGFMSAPLPSQFIQHTYKTIPMQYYQTTASGNKPINNSTGHRYTDYHKGITSQRNSYNHRKTSNSSYSQQQQQGNNGVTSKSRYVLTTDPNPPNLVQDSLGHFVQAEQCSTQVSHSIPTPQQNHYLPAVNAQFAAPFVTPNANDSNIVIMPPRPVGIIPSNIHHRINPRRNPGVSHNHRSSGSYSHNDRNHSGSINFQRNIVYSRSNNSYPSDYSHRFPQKGVNSQHFTTAPFAFPAQAVVQLTPVNEPNHETRSTYSNKQNNGNSQRFHQSSNVDNSGFDSGPFHGNAEKEYYSDITNRRALAGHRSATPPDQKNSHQVGLEQRRNSRQRRTRKTDDERISQQPDIIAPSVPTTTFNLESNSFPPLPGAQEADVAVSTTQAPESRPVSADAVKNTETIKGSTAIISAEPNQVSVNVPPRKYSEISSASHAPRNQNSVKPPPPLSPMEPPKSVKRTEAKSASAANSQSTSDKHPSVNNKRPSNNVRARSVSDKKQAETAQQGNRPRALSGGGQSHLTKKSHSYKDQKKSASGSFKSEHTIKNDPIPIVEASSRHASDSSEGKHIHEEYVLDADKENSSLDGNERRPTYAEIAKTAKVLQLNGKSTSESGNSESGEENPTDDDPKEPEVKQIVEEENTAKSTQEKSDKDQDFHTNSKFDRRTGSFYGYYGRRDVESRRPWHNRHYRDRNFDHRNDRPRDRPFTNERGGEHWGFRGRGNYRGRRSYYRENRYQGGGRQPVSNVPTSNDR